MACCAGWEDWDETEQDGGGIDTVPPTLPRASRAAHPRAAHWACAREGTCAFEQDQCPRRLCLRLHCAPTSAMTKMCSSRMRRAASCTLICHPPLWTLVEVIGGLALVQPAIRERQLWHAGLEAAHKLLLNCMLDLCSYMRTKVLTMLTRLCELPVKLPK